MFSASPLLLFHIWVPENLIDLTRSADSPPGKRSHHRSDPHRSIVQHADHSHSAHDRKMKKGLERWIPVLHAETAPLPVLDLTDLYEYSKQSQPDLLLRCRVT